MDLLTTLFLVIIVVLVACLVVLARERGLLKREIDLRVEQKFEAMKDSFRDEVLERSRATLKGRIAEQIVPFLAQFKHNPADARFIGSPIDFVIFDGYTDIKDRKAETPITVILADVKTGKSDLTVEQRRIKEALDQKRVRFETIQLEA